MFKKVLTPYPSKMKVAYPQKSIRLLKTMAAFSMFKGTLQIFFVEKRLHLQRKVSRIIILRVFIARQYDIAHSF